MRAALARRRVALVASFDAAHGTVFERDLITLSLSDADGETGHGEAAPLPGYDGPDADRVMTALRAYVAVLERAAGLDTAYTERADRGQARPAPREPAGGRRPAPREPAAGPPGGAALLAACRRVDPLPQALAAVDLALWDLAGRRAGVPVARLLHPDPSASVPVNATIGALDRAGAAAAAARAAAAGFACVKVKVGVGDDAGRVAAVRAATGPATALRLDANGAWDVEVAVRAIQSLAPAGLELVEEPCHGLEAIAAVRARVEVRVAIDETAAAPGAFGAGAADAVCLKVSRCGGISGVLAAAAEVRASGAEPYIASTLDGPLGIAAGVHLAAALAASGPLPACGLATLGMLAGYGDVLPVVGGAIGVPREPGLGVGSNV